MGAGDDDVKPTSANTVDEIKKYMDAHNIAYTSTDNKADLLAKLGD